MALKGTLGAGSLVPVAILADALSPLIGLWGMIALVLVPFALVVMIKPGEEIPARVVKFAHGLAAVWYLALVAATVSFMASRGFRLEDGLLGFILALGLIPCAVILFGINRGAYDTKSPAA